MSLFHRLILGHFDLNTFVAHHPVPLQSLDVPRTHRMLAEIGTQTSDTEYDIDGETLYFVNGYCDCPWLSAGCNKKSEEFARAVAQLEDCYLIEKGVGTILHPVRSIQASPSNGRDVLSGRPLTANESAACLAANDPATLRHDVLRAVDIDEPWVESFCVALASHEHFHVRGNAFFALACRARRKKQLTRKIVQPLIEDALDDSHPYAAGHAHLAAKTVELELEWLIHAFDNGLPEIDVTTYSNGWIQCPNCELRFATYDPWAFREGRCLRCRQRLRVHSPQAT